MPRNAASDALSRAIQRHQAGRLPEAEALYREILAREPDCGEALHYLGVIALQRGQHEVAVELIGRAARLAPGNPAIHSNLGEACRHLNRLDDAVASFRRALALQPDYSQALSNLGNALVTQGRLDEAVSCFRRALELQPDFANAHNNLGVALLHLGRFDEALACFRQALVLRPGFSEAHNNLGKLLKERGQLDEAAACFEQALAHRPNFSEAHNNLGGVFKDRGQTEQSLACYRRALALRPNYASAHSNLILALQYRSGHESGAIDAESRQWNERHARPLVPSDFAHANDRSPERPLRIGYISADFRLHPVAYFLLSLLEARDRTRFHVTCYSDNPRPDDVTARFQGCTDEWRSLVGISDHDAARRIRADRIDVLVDLSGHTAGNRLLVFARKPAPVQISYLGYPGATGLETIDWRLTDGWADPSGAAEATGADKVLRLAETAWCFTPLSGQPPVAELPAARHGYVTFGCFNNFAKVSEDMLRLWSGILGRLPRARLAIKNAALASPSVVRRLQTCFAQTGVSADRLELIPRQATVRDHLLCYNRVDLALDTFPYHGTTTTCEALWMGVPVLTLAGGTHVARVGVSLLNSVGLPEFVAGTPDGYVESAVAAAGDWSRLAALRGGLRERMQQSPLMDAPRFARTVEAAYRAAWRQWCVPSVPPVASTR